jgi:hypothetical protein
MYVQYYQPIVKLLSALRHLSPSRPYPCPPLSLTHTHTPPPVLSATSLIFQRRNSYRMLNASTPHADSYNCFYTSHCTRQSTTHQSRCKSNLLCATDSGFHSSSFTYFFLVVIVPLIRHEFETKSRERVLENHNAMSLFSYHTFLY